MNLLDSKILIVDDEAANVRLLQKLLGMEGFTQIHSTSHAVDAVDIYKRLRPDLVLLDLRMPGLNGFEVMAQLQAVEADSYIPVLVMTAEIDPATRVKALQAGAKDFVTKPFDHFEVLIRINNQLEVRNLYKRLQAHKSDLEDTVRARTRELTETRLEVVRRLGRAAEYRDNETGLHIIRMSKMSAALARQHGLSERECELILNASPMHDIGKIGIPDAVLLKPGKLDAAQWFTMCLHPKIGAEILGGHDSDLLTMAHDIALGHHEKWDGGGYPNHLAGDAIPLVARIVAVADVFDALTSVRPYKRAWTSEEALHEMRRTSGQHFEPALIKDFEAILPEILAIKKAYPEPDGVSHLHKITSLATLAHDA